MAKSARVAASKSSPVKPAPAPESAAETKEEKPSVNNHDHDSSPDVPKRIRWTAIPFEAELEKSLPEGGQYKYSKVPHGHRFENKSVVISHENIKRLLANKAIEVVND